MYAKETKKRKRNSKITRTTFDIKFYVKVNEEEQQTDMPHTTPHTTHTKLTVKND